jgi:hypothetical protein
MFLWYAFLTQRQVERAAGFFGGRLLVDSRLTFWTLTVWEGEQRMKGIPRLWTTCPRDVKAGKVAR